MLSKYSLIVVRWAPFLFALGIILRVVLALIIPDPIVGQIINIATHILILIGLSILSFTFIFCTFHRILIYNTIFCYILYLIYITVNPPIFLLTILKIAIIVNFVLMIIVLYCYFKYKCDSPTIKNN